MPWCESCDKFLNPTSMTQEGNCPTCGRHLDAAEGVPFDARAAAKDLDVRALAGEDERVPWHFKLMVVALVAYLAWRLIVAIGAIAG